MGISRTTSHVIQAILLVVWLVLLWLFWDNPVVGFIVSAVFLVIALGFERYAKKAVRK